MIESKPAAAPPVNPGPANSVHVRCGSDILDKLSEAGLPGTAIEWSDPMSQGPIPPTDDPAAFTAVRAKFLATGYRLTEEKVRDALTESDAALDAAVECAEEIVLWFEHDLYDQAILARLLARIGNAAAGRLTIVTLDDHPSVAPFHGLGQLEPDALAELYPAREPVAAGAVAAARQVWAGMRAGDPTYLEAILDETELPGLPYMRAAMRRFLADYPGIDDGLAETERLILRAAADGAGTPGRIFARMQELETAPWMGDLMLWPWIVRLAEAPVPALAFDREQSDGPFDRRFARLPLSLTPFGRGLLEGTAHWLERNQIDRCIGGAGPETLLAWRWDPKAQKLVPAQ